MAMRNYRWRLRLKRGFSVAMSTWPTLSRLSPFLTSRKLFQNVRSFSLSFFLLVFFQVALTFPPPCFLNQRNQNYIESEFISKLRVRRRWVLKWSKKQWESQVICRTLIREKVPGQDIGKLSANDKHNRYRNLGAIWGRFLSKLVHICPYHKTTMASFYGSLYIENIELTFERMTGLEPATFALGSRFSSNWATFAYLSGLNYFKKIAIKSQANFGLLGFQINAD